jgi:hypothetical protein
MRFFCVKIHIEFTFHYRDSYGSGVKCPWIFYYRTYACYTFLSPKAGPLVMASITPASSSPRVYLVGIPSAPIAIAFSSRVEVNQYRLTCFMEPCFPNFTMTTSRDVSLLLDSKEACDKRFERR